MHVAIDKCGLYSLLGLKNKTNSVGVKKFTNKRICSQPVQPKVQVSAACGWDSSSVTRTHVGAHLHGVAAALADSDVFVARRDSLVVLSFDGLPQRRRSLLGGDCWGRGAGQAENRWQINLSVRSPCRRRRQPRRRVCQCR